MNFLSQCCYSRKSLLPLPSICYNAFSQPPSLVWKISEQALVSCPGAYPGCGPGMAAAPALS